MAGEHSLHPKAPFEPGDARWVKNKSKSKQAAQNLRDLRPVIVSLLGWFFVVGRRGGKEVPLLELRGALGSGGRGGAPRDSNAEGLTPGLPWFLVKLALSGTVFPEHVAVEFGVCHSDWTETCEAWPCMLSL